MPPNSKRTGYIEIHSDSSTLSARRRCFVTVVIIRIIRYMPTGQASNATMLSKPLPTPATESDQTARKGLAVRRSNGAAQHTNIMSIPLSVLFFCACGAPGFPTSWLAVSPNSYRLLSTQSDLT